MKRGIVDTVMCFYHNLRKHRNHRYLSWEHCFTAFQRTNGHQDLDYLALHLAFYLASWGMYRGSSGLLWKDYKVHIETVRIIRRYPDIQCSTDNEVRVDQIDRILSAKEEIRQYYTNVEFVKPTMDGEAKHNIVPSDTLISKIILGTLGCVPAYDRLLRLGFDEIKNDLKIGKSLNATSLKNLFDFVSRNPDSFAEIKRRMHDYGIHYPLMKIVDMYFWELGRLKNPGLVANEKP